MRDSIARILYCDEPRGLGLHPNTHKEFTASHSLSFSWVIRRAAAPPPPAPPQFPAGASAASAAGAPTASAASAPSLAAGCRAAAADDADVGGDGDVGGARRDADADSALASVPTLTLTDA